MHAQACRHSALVVLLLLSPIASAESLDHWPSSAKDIESWIIDRQQELHQIPELLFEVPKTYAALEKYLRAIGVQHRRPNSGHGLIAEIGSGAEPIVVLRSDIDALPIQEIGSAPKKSKHEGKSHMCGHDGHMAMLLGAARLLHDAKDTLKGTVRLVFQPAEEGGAGGDIMAKEGALDNASAAFGFHVMPTIKAGHIGSRAGTIMAAASVLKVVVTGLGGHAAMPHTTRDPVVAATALVQALQALISRETDPLGSAVLSITQIHGGTAFNVVPDSVELQGTVRALSDEQMARLKKRIEEVVKHQALSFGCTAEADWREDVHPYYPPVVNDEKMHLFASDVASRMLGPERVDSSTPTLMAGEDFAFFARHIPSAFLFLGIRNETHGSVHGLHNARFRLDESQLKIGAAMHAAIASEFLAQQAASGSRDEL